MAVSFLEFINAIKDLGFPVALAAFLIFTLVGGFVYVMYRAANSLDDIKALLRVISLNVGKTFLSSEQTLDMFRWCLAEHIQQKLKFAEDLLIKNDIKRRKEEIKAQLQSEFYRITQEEATKLSTFNTPAGDLGQVLLSIDFEEFMDEIYVSFFSDNERNSKIADMRAIMNNYVNDLTRQIKSRIAANYL